MVLTRILINPQRISIISHSEYHSFMIDIARPSKDMESSTVFVYTSHLNTSTGMAPTATKISVKNSKSFFSEAVADRVTFINVILICTVLSILGVTTNVANIVVFCKVGFRETINISLLAIAVSDTWSLITLLWKAFCFNPLVINSDFPFLSLEVEMLTAGGPHQMAMNATAWLTAFVTFERCLCIAFPMKVKSLITVTRTKLYAVAVFFLVVVCQVPIYYATRLGWKFVPERNRTLLGLVFIENRGLIDKLSFYLANFLSTISSFVLIVICTVILIVKLKQTSKWRQKTTTKKTTTTTTSTDEASRERRVIKMVASVAVIFIVCYTPSVVLAIFMAKDPEFRIVGAYRNDFVVALNVGAVFEAVNATVNIFVYYHMSAKYKRVYRSILCKKGEEGGN